MGTTNQMTLAGEEKAILDIVSDDAQEHFDVGVHYNNITANDLALKAGYASTRAYVNELVLKSKVLSQATLSLYGAIARNFTREQADRCGTSVLGRFLTYQKLASYSPSPFESAVVRVPDEKGKLCDKSIFDCTDDDMKAALRALRGTAQPLSAEDAEAIEMYQAALDELLGADHPSSIKPHVRKQETTVDFTGLPARELPQIFAALHAAGKPAKAEDGHVVQMLADALEEARREGDDMAIRAKSRNGETLVTLSDVPLSVFREVLDVLKRRADVVLR